jgi:ABC-type uncharacterized transport system substrate-binding protein
MKRREFIALFGGAAAVWPLAANAQVRSDRPARIGVLRISPIPERSLAALRRGLSAKGYTEGQQYVFAWGFGDGDAQKLPELATALVQDGIDVIVTEGNTGALAARAASEVIPIIMATSADPFRAGLIKSLSRPGGNVTGNSSEAPEMSGKLLQLAKEIVPELVRVAHISPPIVWDIFAADTQAAARSLNLKIVRIDLALPNVEAAFRKAADAQVRAAIVRGRPFFSTGDAKLTVESAVAYRLPVIYESRDFVEYGGLVSFGVDVPGLYFRVAEYVDKILKGVDPGDLPVQQPTKFETVVNLKTAKQLALTVPTSILLRADEVIE